MIFPSFTTRSNEAELMDGADYSVDEFVENLADLRRVNRWLGGKSALTRHLFPMIERLVRSGERERPESPADLPRALSPLRLLDVGTGSADIPVRIIEWGRRRGFEIEFMVIDLNEIAVREARLQTPGYPEIKVVRADAMNLPFADESFDFVIASLFLHHFRTPQAAALLRSFARVARSAFIINDLRRHPIAYYTIKFLTWIFTRNRLVRNDSALSVLRGFVEREIAEIAGAAEIELKIFRHFPYRFILIGTAPQPSPSGASERL